MSPYGSDRKCIKRLLFVASTRFGELAQMVERSLSMREVPGSMPGFSTSIFFFHLIFLFFFINFFSLVTLLWCFHQKAGW